MTLRPALAPVALSPKRGQIGRYVAPGPHAKEAATRALDQAGCFVLLARGYGGVRFSCLSNFTPAERTEMVAGLKSALAFLEAMGAP